MFFGSQLVGVRLRWVSEATGGCVVFPLPCTGPSHWPNVRGTIANAVIELHGQEHDAGSCIATAFGTLEPERRSNSCLQYLILRA